MPACKSCPKKIWTMSIWAELTQYNKRYLRFHFPHWHNQWKLNVRIPSNSFQTVEIKHPSPTKVHVSLGKNCQYVVHWNWDIINFFWFKACFFYFHSVWYQIPKPHLFLNFVSFLKCDHEFTLSASKSTSNLAIPYIDRWVGGYR